MSETSDYTIVVCGPLAQKAPVLAALGRFCDLSEQQHSPDHWPRIYGDSDPAQGWAHCRHSDIDQVADTVTRSGWRLCAHWVTPVCGVCAGRGQANGPGGLGVCSHCDGRGATNVPAGDPLRAELDSLRARLAALEAR